MCECEHMYRYKHQMSSSTLLLCGRASLWTWAQVFLARMEARKSSLVLGVHVEDVWLIILTASHDCIQALYVSESSRGSPLTTFWFEKASAELVREQLGSWFSLHLVQQYLVSVALIHSRLAVHECLTHSLLPILQ